MITEQDIRKLQEWSHAEDAPMEVKAWHAQILVEFTDYVRYLEGELLNEKSRNIDLEEQVRFLNHQLHCLRNNKL